MAQKNRLELNIPEADLAEINAALETLNTKLAPHLIALSPEDRMLLPKMGDKTKAFVDKSREYASKYSEFLPPFLSMDSFDRDLQAIDFLTSTLQSIAPLSRNLDDSLLLSGSEAYQASLIYYRSVKVASENDVPNAKSIYGDLAKRFEIRAQSKSQTATEAETV